MATVEYLAKYVDTYNNFLNLLLQIFQHPNELQNWLELILVYVAPMALIFYILKDFLEEIRLLSNTNTSTKIAALMTLISFPYGTYIFAGLVAVYGVYAVIAVFGALLFIGIAHHYKKKASQYDFVMGSAILTNIIVHLPLIVFITIGMLVINKLYGNETWLTYLTKFIGILGILLIAYGIPALLQILASKDKINALTPDNLAKIGIALVGVFSLLGVVFFNMFTAILEGIVLGLLVMLANQHSHKHSLDIVRQRISAIDDKVAYLDVLERAKYAVQYLLKVSDQQRPQLYSQLSKPYKDALKIVGIRSGAVSKEVLLEILPKIDKEILAVKSYIDTELTISRDKATEDSQ